MRKLALVAAVGVSTTAAAVVAACGLALATSLSYPKLELVSVRPMLLGKFVRVHVRCPEDPEGVCYLGQVALFDRRHHFLGLSTGRRVRSGESIVRSVPLPAAARHRARANGKLGAIALIVGCGTQCKRTWSFMRGQGPRRLIVIRAGRY